MAGYANPIVSYPGASGPSNPFGGNPAQTSLNNQSNTTPMFGGFNQMAGGSNQYMNFPGMPNPGQAPSPTTGGQQNQQYNPFQVPPQNNFSMGNPPGSSNYVGSSSPNGKSYNEGHGVIASALQYPGLSQNFTDWLSSQMGQGLNPFNLSSVLPTGGSTAPGQLTAGENPLLQQLAQFFQTGQGGGMPGANTLSTIANQGISALPEWQQMIQAQQQNIQQNQAQLAGQFAGMGDIAGSGFGNAMQTFQQGTTATQNALLGQLQQQNILQGQIPAAQFLQSGATQMAGGLQNLDQSAITNMLQQFNLDQPQNNPLLQYMGGLSTLYAPTNKTPTGFEQFTGLLGALSGSGASSGGTSVGF